MQRDDAALHEGGDGVARGPVLVIAALKARFCDQAARYRRPAGRGKGVSGQFGTRGVRGGPRESGSFGERRAPGRGLERPRRTRSAGSPAAGVRARCASPPTRCSRRSGPPASTIPTSRSCSRDTYEILNERHRSGSIIVTSNRGPDEWLATFADPLRTQSASDRFVKNAYDLIIDGESYRKRPKPSLDTPPASGQKTKPSRRRINH